MLGTHWKGRKCGNPLRGTCLKGMLEYVTPSEARGLGWWVQAAMEEPRTRFLVASLLGMTVLRQSRCVGNGAVEPPNACSLAG